LEQIAVQQARADQIGIEGGEIAEVDIIQAELEARIGVVAQRQIAAVAITAMRNRFKISPSFATMTSLNDQCSVVA
jgi:hypothetical protein